MKIAASSGVVPVMPSFDDQNDITTQTPAAFEPLPPIERAASALNVIALLLVIGALWWAQVVLIPIVLSMLMSYALEPLVVRLETIHIRRAIAVPLVMLSLFGAIATTTYALRGEAVAFAERVPAAMHTVSGAIRRVSLGGPLGMARMREAARELETATTGPTDKRPRDGVTPVRVEQPTFRWSDWLVSGSRSAGEFSAQMFAVLCLTYYLLAAGDAYKRKLVHLVPTLTEKKITVQILNEIDRQIGRFLLARAAISLVVAVAIWMAFRLLGVDNAGVWALLSALLFAVPIAGPTAMVVLAGIAAFLQFGTFFMTGAVTAVCIVIAALEGNVLTPWLMSRVGEMSAVAVFVSLLFWGWIWGLWGLLLAVPITAAVKAVCDRIPGLSPMAEMLKE